MAVSGVVGAQVEHVKCADEISFIHTFCFILLFFARKNLVQAAVAT